MDIVKKPKLPVKLIIDTDPGVDDAMALGIALTWPTAEVLAVTCVHGNVSVDQCCTNAARVLGAFERTDVTLYRGAEKPLIGDNRHATYFHGNDGFADCTDGCEEPDTQPKDEHAAFIIIELAKKHKGEITLCALGPLTNLALAVKLMPELPSLLKEVIILGGNYTGLGNATVAGEFNFVADPAAAHIVLKEYTCTVTVLPNETFVKCTLSRSFITRYSSYDNPRAKLCGKIVNAFVTMHSELRFPGDLIGGLAVDVLPVIAALDKGLILESCEVYAVVETAGQHTKGTMIVDWRNLMSKKPNIKLVKLVDMDLVREMLIHSVK